MSDTAKAMPMASEASMAARLKRYSVWIAGALILLLAPYVFSSGASITTMCLMGIMIVFALSYNMLLGQTGMLSFGHAVYYGLAAFVTAHMMNWVIKSGAPIPLPLIPIAGALAGLFFGIVFGSVSTKRGGTAFAMISLGLGELVYSSSLILRSFFGGEEGISADRTKLLRFFGYNFGPQIQVYYLIAAWCFLCVILMYAITRTPLGRMCNAVRENPERVEFVGYNPQFVRFIAFSLAGLFAGVAGSLAAINIELAQASFVGAAQSGAVLLAAYIGGVAFFVGPILGAVIVTLLSIKLSDFSEIWILYFGVLFITIILFAPYGISGLLMMHAQFWRGPMGSRFARFGKLLGSYLVAAIPAFIMVAGAVLLIEMIHHVAQKGAEGPMMHFLRRSYLTVNTHAALPWIGGVVALIGGFFAFRMTWPIVAKAWNDALTDAQRSGA